MKIIETEDGSHSIYSERFGTSYHSIFGAIEESIHIFINAGLKYSKRHGRTMDILEIGFGTGLNAFLSLIHAEKFDFQINYFGVEAFPVKKEITDQLNYPSIIEKGKYRSEFKGIHQSEWNTMSAITRCFSLQKDLCRFDEIQYINLFDLVYFDAFSPKEQAEAWTTPLLSKIYKSMKMGAILVTYCAQGQFKRNLISVGFKIETLQGPGRKREMTRAVKFDQQ